MPTHLPPHRFWLIAAAVIAGVLWLLKPILLPFVAAFVLAYFLSPVVSALGRVKIPRTLGTLFVLFAFAAVVAVLLLLLAPLLQNQIGSLIDSLPAYVDALRNRLTPLAEKWLGPIDSMAEWRDAAAPLASNAAGWIGDLLKKIISGSLAIFDILALVIVTPVVTFYLLRDWPKVVKGIDAHLPRQHRAVIHREWGEVDRALSGFIRGQALVCVCLGLIYGLGLTLAGLKYGATIGIIAGFLSFMPYVGSTFVLFSSLALAFVQFDDVTRILFVFLVFVIGQAMEGYVLTPKLVGDRVGLHPVWILFALFTGGSLLGFVGVLIAVPVAAIIGVLIRFALGQYRNSALYHNSAKP